MICAKWTRCFPRSLAALTDRRAAFASHAVKRHDNYAGLERRDIDAFGDILGAENVVQDSESLQTGNRSSLQQLPLS